MTDAWLIGVSEIGSKVVVGLGSNIDPDRNLRWAWQQLVERFDPVRASSLYRSKAFGFDGPDFLNMVVAFRTAWDADRVEQCLSELEDEAGRNTDDRSGSRTLDLDLLLFGQRVDATRRLPRDDILLYPFVLGPLAELEPGLIHPVTGVVIENAWASVEGDAGLERLGRLDSA